MEASGDEHLAFTLLFHSTQDNNWQQNVPMQYFYMVLDSDPSIKFLRGNLSNETDNMYRATMNIQAARMLCGAIEVVGIEHNRVTSVAKSLHQRVRVGAQKKSNQA